MVGKNQKRFSKKIYKIFFIFFMFVLLIFYGIYHKEFKTVENPRFVKQNEAR